MGEECAEAASGVFIHVKIELAVEQRALVGTESEKVRA